MYIRVIVTPDSKKEIFEDKGHNTYEIKVREPAERNLANKQVIKLIADHFAVSAGKVRIVTGHHSRVKIISIDN